MRFPVLQVVIQVPALDRLLDRLDAGDKTQAEIDALTQRITSLTARLKAAVSKSQ